MFRKDGNRSKANSVIWNLTYKKLERDRKLLVNYYSRKSELPSFTHANNSCAIDIKIDANRITHHKTVYKKIRALIVLTLRETLLSCKE